MNIKIIIITSFLLISYCNFIFPQDYWTQVGSIDTALRSIAINQNGDIFVGSNIYGVYRSTDNGDNWIQTLTDGVFCIDINSNGHIFAGDGGVYRSTDNGDNWTQINTGMEGYIGYSMAINSNGDIFVGTCGYGDEGIFRSTDNGNSWIKLNVSSGYNCVRDITINSNGNIFACKEWEGIYCSTDNGENWINIGLIGKYAYSIAINSSEDIFAATSDSIFLSTDNGTNWSQINNGLININIRDIAINSNDDIFIATYGDGVYRSIDNGANWTQINSGLANTLVNSSIFNSNGVIFAGTQGGLYKSTQSTISIKENSFINNFKFQNFPNPFTSETVIYYTIPSDYSDLIKITIYNSYRIKIKEFVHNVHNGGNYTVTFSAKSLPAGIYYYNINCKNYNQTKKMVLIK